MAVSVEWATKIMKQYAQQVADILGLPVPQVYVQVVNKPGDNPAWTSGDTIYINKAEFQDGDKGAIVHELAHVFMQGASYTDKNSWVQEGLADYVRGKVGLGEGRNAQYLDNAKFFGWLARVNPDGFQAFVADAKSGDKHAFQATYGLSGDNLRKMYDQGVTPQEIQSGNSDNNDVQIIHNHFEGSAGAGPIHSQGPHPSTGGGGTTTGSDLPPLPKPPGDKQRADARAAHRNYMNARATFRAMLNSWGIELNDNAWQLVEQAASHGWNTAHFLNQFRQTDLYAQRFPGIFDENGNPKMTEDAYITTEKQYQAAAQAAGINFGQGKEAYLFRNDVSPAEFQTKAEAIRRLKDNQQLFNQFSKELVAQGIAKPGEVTQEALFKTVMGAGNQEWYKLWNMTVARNAARDAGLVINAAQGAYGALPRHLVKQVANKGLSEDALDQGFAQAADMFLTTLPESRIQKYGLSKKQILAAVFGGKNSAQVKQQIQHIMAQDEAFQQDRASTQTAANAQGGFQVLGGAGDRAAY